MQDLVFFSSLLISGPDAAVFLQGQLTCDINQVTNQFSFGAYCDSRGRMIANFMIKKDGDSFQLILPDSMLNIITLQLKKFSVFSKVTLAIDETPIHDMHVENKKLELIKQGIAFIYPETSLLFTPQMINWEKYGGVSFTKGCYVGQEIVARTQHLGKLKRHLHQFTLNKYLLNTLPAPGTELTNDEKECVGILCDAALEQETLYGLVVVQDNALSAKVHIFGNNITITT